MKRLLSTFALLALLAVPSSAQYALQFGATVAVEGEQVFVGEGRNLLMPGNVFVFERDTDGAWGQVATLTPADATDEALGFGRAMSVSGTTLVVGAPLEQAAYVFEKDASGAWVVSGKLAEEGVQFGSSIVVEGDHLLVGAPGDRETAGTVYTYHRSEQGTWEATGTLTSEDAGPRDAFGSVLALQQGRAVVAAPMKDNRAGAVYAFNYNAQTSQWDAVGMLDAQAIKAGHRFGSSLLVVGSHLAVGAPGYENRIGVVAIYTFDEADGIWQYDRRVAPYDGQGGEQFGSSLTFAQGSLMVGAPGYGDREGAVYRFATNMETGRMSGTWQMGPSDLQFRSGFGTSLAARGEVLVVGAVGHDNFEGAAFPYVASDEGWTPGNTVYTDTGKFASVKGGMVKCEDGEAGAFTCDNVDMVSFLSREDIGANRGIQVNDVWGWEDEETGGEYALIGRTDGTSFVDLTDPNNPVYLGDLPMTETANRSIWRDIKVYKDHAYIVADGAGAHHLQIFDLRQLRDVENPPMTFEETAIYKGIFSSHNIIINEDTGYAYAVGSDSGGETCGGALHMINIQDPTNPTFAGCFADTRTGRGGSGATHDAQCVTYQGPDSQYLGREICLYSALDCRCNG